MKLVHALLLASVPASQARHFVGHRGGHSYLQQSISNLNTFADNTVKEAQLTRERLQDAEEMINNRRMYELVQQEGPARRTMQEERALIKNLNKQ